MKPSDEDYADMFDMIESARSTIEQLEEEPYSPKREAALRLLRERLSFAIRQLNRVESHSHRN
jgi:hypothetical protein